MRSSIELEQLATITGIGDTVDFIGRPAPASSNDGRFMAVARMETRTSLVALLDSSGRYLKTVGRVGSGPGEYSRLASFGFGPGDSLWIADGMVQAHLFTPAPEARYVRTVRFERMIQPIITTSGFVAMPVFSVDRNGNARLDGARLFSFGGAQVATYGPSLEGENPDVRMGAVGFVDSAQVWAAWRGVYTVDLLGSDGTLKQRINRQVDWFPADTTTQRTMDEPPRPSISAIDSDDEGNLWILVRRAHRDWAVNRSARKMPVGPVAPSMLAGGPLLDKLFEGVIEVLDARTGALIATREVGGGVLGFMRPGVIYEQVEDDAGTLTIVLSRVTLARD